MNGINFNNQMNNTKWNKNWNNNRLKYFNDFDCRLIMDKRRPSFFRSTGGGGSKCGKKKKAISERCVYDSKIPFDFLLTKKDKKSKKIRCQRSDICCENWKDSDVIPKCYVEKKCNTDACAKCDRRKKGKKLKKEYYADCQKVYDKSLVPSDCQTAWEESQRICDGKIYDDLNITYTMQTDVEPNLSEQNESSNDSCDICLNNKAAESYKIKKGSNQGNIKLCSECSTKVDKNVKECSIRSAAGGGCCKQEDINCEEGKCVKDCKKYKTPKPYKPSGSKPCCPNCTRKTEPEEEENVEENPCQKKKSSSYCCNYSKNKKKRCGKGKTIEVCDHENCPKKTSKSKECPEDSESKPKTLCECPKGCKCLCSKYSFFPGQSCPKPVETPSEKPVVTIQKSDCEDPQVNEMIEELKSEMGSLLKKLEVLGKSQCKCALKRDEVVLFATQVINNPFDNSNKLNRYIEINNDSSIVRSNHDAINKSDILINTLEQNTNTTFIMPPNNKQMNDGGSMSVSEFPSKSSVHQNEKRESPTELQRDESTVIIEKLTKHEDLCESHTEVLDKLENKKDAVDLLNKEMVKKNFIEKESCSIKQQNTNKIENNIEIISAKVVKDSNNKKQKLLLHLHMKKRRKMANENL
ncbi:uncharacterized protein LOC123294921 [Chrysoperla carnea]|uniref:uncharacterized protein LOC123294921 n=1 Tax=Chrysoperla carnea TaxID=189513 RepID=UPI001D06322A|nr:uncharacterized protein LOC123294921 [Chrysoperla carnea]